MTHDRIEQADLDWWVGLASALEWTFAHTYAQTAPHSYVVLGRTAGMTKGDYVRAGRVIHTFGRPAKFYGMTSIYLTSPDGRMKWWTMDREVTETNLINQATSDRLYGVQNAPSTAGVDPSQPMLNQLVRKYPNVGAVYPMRIEQALAAWLFTPGQFEIVTALLSDVDHLDDGTIAGLAEIASRGLIVARGDEVTVVDTRRSVAQAHVRHERS